MKYASDILIDAQMLDSQLLNVSFSHGILISEPSEPLQNPEIYRKVVGRLLYMGFTRPDLSYATQQLSEHMQTPCQHHLQAALHTIRYLKGTINGGLFYPSLNDFKLHTYCDAD